MSLSINDILNEEMIEKFQESFAFSTGFGVVFVDVEGNHIGKGSNFSEFCQQINSTKEGAIYCARTNKKAIHLAMRTSRPSIYVCHAGLVNIVIPLIFEGEYIGALTAGNVLCSETGIYPRDPVLCGLAWLETERAKDFFEDISILSPKQIESTAVSLENTVNYIIQTASYNQLQKKLEKEKRKILEYEKRQIEMEHQLKLAELDALQKQVTPHFIFNVIGSISRLISVDKKSQAKKMIDAFSKMLRYSLFDSSTAILLEQEIGYIENYLKIQKYRFSDRLDYKVFVDKEVKKLKIPYFSLQPLIENAIEHGILTLEKGGCLEVLCLKTQLEYTIEITDNGVGMKKSKMSKIKKCIYENYRDSGTKHVGIYNCYRRLKLMYGELVDFNIYSKINEGTKIKIRIKTES